MDLLLIIAAFIVHIYILINEYKYKKIPNKYLILLLGINLLYIGINIYDIGILSIFIKSVLISFFLTLLYIFKIWNPSYLKYIFISSLFFLGSLELTFLSNIFFIILFYIIGYFLYFYTHLLFDVQQTKSIYHSLKKDVRGNLHNWVIKNKNNLILKVITIILGFISVFILIRVFRYYVQGELNPHAIIYKIDNLYINTLVLIYIFLFIITAALHKGYHKYLQNNYKLLGGIIFITIGFLIYEFIYDYEFINEYLHRIITFILFLFVFIWIIMHMGKYLFFENDSKIIDYSYLKTGDIFDKKMVASYLIGQKSLDKYDMISIINNIKNPLSKEDCEKLKAFIEKNNDYHIKHDNATPPNVVRVYNTFIFSPFIFGSFILTLFIQENILINFLIFIFKKTMSLGD